MSLFLWCSLALTCLLGAMSPGPSFVVILRSSMNHGRRIGVLCAIAHSFGVGAWAVLTIFGLATILSAHPELDRGIQLAGGIYLLYLAWGILKPRFQGRKFDVDVDAEGSPSKALQSSFLIAFINPKLFVFFLALFSQFVSDAHSLIVQLGMAIVALIVDALWYAFVAGLVTHGRARRLISIHIERVNLILALVFISLGIKVIFFN